MTKTTKITLKGLELLVAVSETPKQSLLYYQIHTKVSYSHIQKISQDLDDLGLISRINMGRVCLLNLTEKGKHTVGSARLILNIDKTKNKYSSSNRQNDRKDKEEKQK